MSTRESIKQQIEVASGRKRAQLVVKHANIVDVFTHNIVEGSLAVSDGKIVGIGAYEGEQEIDAQGKYLIPGLVDSHVHIESAMVSPEQFAEAVLPRGTTTVIADPHEIANVCGLDGIRYMLQATEHLPLHTYVMLPSCVPATQFEHSGAVLGVSELEQLIDHPRVLGLGEVMDYYGTAAGEDQLVEKIAMARSRNKHIDGHSPMLEGKDLTAYAAAGITTDHECSTVEEMNDRISRGMYVLLRQGSAAKNLPTLLRGVNQYNSRRCLFCTDDRQPEDILKDGHIDNHLRTAVALGTDAVTAVQMATINAAECYGLEKTGALAPGYQADFLILDNLQDFTVEQVFIGGTLQAKEGACLDKFPRHSTETVTGTVHTAPLTKEMFTLPLNSDVARVIRINANTLVTEHAIRKVFRDTQGNFINDRNLDLLKLAVVERHTGSARIGLGIVENYQLHGGAIATTIAHDSHNIIAIGDNDDDLALAVEHIISISGGITMCAQGKVLDSLPLPIAGLMSEEGAEFVSDKLKAMHQVAFSTFGINPEIDPFMTLSFLALPVIPDLKLTDMGLFDVREFSFVDISVT
ncbi:MAG: adenine deaminase [Spirochaetota bacterium]